MSKETGPLWELEGAAWAQGRGAVCGCDEAGAGPLAGPVYAGAVILPRGAELPGLNDSKKLTAKKRDVLYELILDKAIAWAVASVEAEEIDKTDILSARMKAMQTAIDRLSPAADSILAKVSRDRYMEEMAERYPAYQFEKHKGYGTRLHYAMLDAHGPSPIHRRSFLKRWEAARNG